jgi:hypothetical protein
LEKALKFSKVPRTILQTLAKKVTLPAKQAATTKLERKTVLGDSLEQDLVKYIFLLEDKIYGLMRNDLRRMAYALASRNGLKQPFGS